jgi:hypothetical protein
MPDDLDYEWFGWLVANPDEWTPRDLELAEAILVNQKDAVRDSHPKDAKGRDRLQRVVIELESAIAEYRHREAGSQR